MTDLNHNRTGSLFHAWVAALLFAGVIALPAIPALAGRLDNKPQPKSRCESKKDLAAGQYFRCLTKAIARFHLRGSDPYERAFARCDEDFDSAFAEAEAGGQCRTAGGPSTIRGPIRMQAEATAADVATGPGCPSGKLTVRAGETATCQVSTTASAIDLGAIVSQLQADGVDGNTVLWIQAWGATGAPGAEVHGGPGGRGGYAQTTTTVNQFLSDFGTTEIHYYLGNTVPNLPGTGGPGGAATIVSTADLTQDGPSFYTTVLVAGAGGGGGAGRGEKTDVCGFEDYIYGGGGGDGAVAIATENNVVAVAAGARGGAAGSDNVNNSGYGGGPGLQGPGGDNGGGSAKDGGTGYACFGGLGGNLTGPLVGFINQTGTKIDAAGGQGGNQGDDAGGGGGGGGLGGGGGGAEGDSDSKCVSGGGGGGGSLAVPSDAACSAAPTSIPPNPNSTLGIVQIVFDLGACSGS